MTRGWGVTEWLVYPLLVALVGALSVPLVGTAGYVVVLWALAVFFGALRAAS